MKPSLPIVEGGLGPAGSRIQIPESSLREGGRSEAPQTGWLEVEPVGEKRTG